MTRHTDLADGVKATSSRSIHLGGLHPEATREEVASEIERLGYTNCKFLWPKINPGFPEGQTRTDYCFVRFNTRGTADQAMETISQAALSIRGRPVTVKTSKHAVSIFANYVKSCLVATKADSKVLRRVLMGRKMA